MHRPCPARERTLTARLRAAWHRTMPPALSRLLDAAEKVRWSTLQMLAVALVAAAVGLALPVPGAPRDTVLIVSPGTDLTPPPAATHHP